MKFSEPIEDSFIVAKLKYFFSSRLFLHLLRYELRVSMER